MLIQRICLAGVILMAAATGGCMHQQPMALDAEGGGLDLSAKSVVLLSLAVQNEHRPRYKLCPQQVVVEPAVEASAGADVAKEHGHDMDTFQLRYKAGGGKGWQCFKVGSPYNSSPNGSCDYLLSLALSPGTYRLRYIVTTATIVPLHPSGKAWSFVPIYAGLVVEPRSVQYAGSIEAVNRLRKNNAELRSGPLLPLLNQSLAGFSDGAYRLTVTDRYEEDVSAFRHAYPALGTLEIKKTILHPAATISTASAGTSAIGSAGEGE